MHYEKKMVRSSLLDIYALEDSHKIYFVLI
jgi:hypothetical protein